MKAAPPTLKNLKTSSQEFEKKEEKSIAKLLDEQDKNRDQQQSKNLPLYAAL